MTNREVLNKLPNDKLAKILDHIDCDQCMYNEEPASPCHPGKKCAEGIRLWLEAEAKPLMTGLLEKKPGADLDYDKFEGGSGMKSDLCTGYFCVACPHGRFCSNEDEMFNRLVESTKRQVEKWGLYWIDISFEEQDRVARKAFDRYREWLKDYGFTGREPSYKKYICYSSDTLEPCYECGCHTGTFYFKPVAKEG